MLSYFSLVKFNPFSPYRFFNFFAQKINFNHVIQEISKIQKLGILNSSSQMAHVRTMVGTMLEQDWELPLASSKEDCWNITVDDTVDPGAARTNQRAELLAAIAGLNKLKESYEEDRGEYIVVTDSEYVVKGITEWFPTWRVRLY